VWATDRDQAEELKSLLEASGCEVSPARGGNAEDRTLNLDIGVVALEGMHCLRNAGYSFRWHPGQHPLDRATDRYGIPVAGGV
jgi:hypothetical protein